MGADWVQDGARTRLSSAVIRRMVRLAASASEALTSRVTARPWLMKRATPPSMPEVRFSS